MNVQELLANVAMVQAQRREDLITKADRIRGYTADRVWIDDLDPGPLRNLGSIHLEPQPLTDWGDREDHTPATIQMDPRGRDRLIAALIAGDKSIEVYGASGGGYTLNLEVD